MEEQLADRLRAASELMGRGQNMAAGATGGVFDPRQILIRLQQELSQTIHRQMATEIVLQTMLAGADKAKFMAAIEARIGAWNAPDVAKQGLLATVRQVLAMPAA